jgi:hypothetical protein
LAQTGTVLNCIREVLGSDLGQDNDYTHWGISCFPESLQKNIDITKFQNQ